MNYKCKPKEFSILGISYLVNLLTILTDELQVLPLFLTLQLYAFYHLHSCTGI
jgi:hypothetical protein